MPKPVAKSTTPTSHRNRLLSRACVAVPFCALAFLVWIDTVRIGRVEYVSGLAGWSVSGPTPGERSGWQPRLIVPEHDNASYEWLDQTRQMFAGGEWRVRRVDYENAPDGHEVFATSPYRWWLGLVAWSDHVLSGRASGPSLERAALLADPLIHLLLLVGTTIFVAWQFGAFPAALVSVGVAALFPLAGDFIPGAPNDHGLAQAFALWSVLPLLVGIRASYSASADAGVRARRWFFASGVAGAAGLWISATTLVPVLAGIALGAVIAALVSRGDATGGRAGAQGNMPWRDWAAGGAAASLCACLIEFFPAHLAYWELRVIHPLYGLAWLGGGEALARTTAWIQGTRPEHSLRSVLIWMLSIAAIAGVPLAMWRTHSLGVLEADLPALRLARLPDSPAAPDLWAWVVKDGFTPVVWATVLPLVLALPPIWLLMRRGSGPAVRVSIAVALGPLLVALGFACRRLAWWNGLDGLLLALLVPATEALCAVSARRFGRWAFSAAAVLALLPGAIRVIPREDGWKRDELNQAQVVGLVERDIARWVAMHAGAAGAVVLAPPNATTAMFYYGGVRGLATLGWENRDGLGGAIRIVSATTPEEAQDLIGRRGVTHIVIPQWDPYLDVYARMGLGRLEGTFIDRLHRWELPPWLQPVPFILPTSGGSESQSVTVFEVVDPQDDAAAAGRLAEYFVEMDQSELAASAAQALRRYPADLGALVAQAQVENARSDMDGFARTVELLLPLISGQAERTLPWDRRVSLAVVLALGQRMDLAREQVRKCLADVDEGKLRSLSVGSLYHLEVLSKAAGLGIADLHLRGLALDLLPPTLRDRLGQ
jgi:hypothetical protein